LWLRLMLRTSSMLVASLVILAPLAAEEIAPAAVDPPATGSEEGSGIATPPGRSRFWQRITAYEPTYLLVEPFPGGGRNLNVKFQFSLAFQLLGSPDAEPHPGDERANGLYGAFSQTSFWDLGAESEPFLDSSYRPELMWHHGFTPGLLGSDGLAIEGGVGHESNGKTAADSRALNLVFIRPIVRWDLDDGWWIHLGPRFHTYISSLDDNPDIARFRGYANLDASVGIRDGGMLMLRGRVGSEWDRGSLQADVSYPLDRISGGWVHGFAYVQGFFGWSESLVAYDQEVAQPRVLVGIAITR